MSMTCGEATMRLLARYGVTTVFGIPGVHTLDLCRGLSGGENSGVIKHVQARNEQGAGFMAEGWARATGEVGVAIVISGPGVTNAATAVGQCYADSLPMLLISAEPEAKTIGKGWGVLHEITEQKKVTEPLCAFSATAHRASDIPELMARAFSVFSSSRPRPCHISLPLDVQAEIVEEVWEPVNLPGRPTGSPNKLVDAADLLKEAKLPVIMVGGGASGAAKELQAVVKATGSIVVASTAGKGIVPDDHPQSLSASTVRPEVQALLAKADVILAVGTEISETDSFVERLEFSGELIRIDIDPAKISDYYPPKIGIVSDAKPAMEALKNLLQPLEVDTTSAEEGVEQIRSAIVENLTTSESQHAKLLGILDEIAPDNTIWSGDACQLVYTGAFMMPVRKPKSWFYPAGFCALGNALPNGIGAKMAKPDHPVVVMAGDGGFMFTMPELMVAAEAKMALPIIIWENGGLKQIQDDMDSRDIERVGVEGINPDFVALANACHCDGVVPEDEAEFKNAFLSSLEKDRPTIIVVREGGDWLL